MSASVSEPVTSVAFCAVASQLPWLRAQPERVRRRTPALSERALGAPLAFGPCSGGGGPGWVESGWKGLAMAWAVVFFEPE